MLVIHERPVTIAAAPFMGEMLLPGISDRSYATRFLQCLYVSVHPLLGCLVARLLIDAVVLLRNVEEFQDLRGPEQPVRSNFLTKALDVVDELEMLFRTDF